MNEGYRPRAGRETAEAVNLATPHLKVRHASTGAVHSGAARRQQQDDSSSPSLVLGVPQMHSPVSGCPRVWMLVAPGASALTV
ncbi:MAG: hypothetical protein QOI50_1571 [Pseudonocardiales bacterium]|nr:hypothetical protein [Pseudonocardiales bacterium]